MIQKLSDGDPTVLAVGVYGGELKTFEVVVDQLIEVGGFFKNYQLIIAKRS